MKKAILAVLLLATFLVPQVEAQGNGVGACPFSAGSLTSSYQEMITVSSTAVGFTASTWKPTDGRPQAVCALVVVNTNSVSWWPTGSTPTAAVGVLQATSTSFSVGSQDMAKFLMIRATGSDSLVAIIYFTLAQ